MRAFRAQHRKQQDASENSSKTRSFETDFKVQGSHRLRPERWRTAFDVEGKITGFQKALRYIISGGVDHSIRSEVWEFLLGCYDLGSTSRLRDQIRQARRKKYHELVQQCRTMHVSIGTGTLAYTVGSKVMDVRITSRESARKAAEVVMDTGVHEEKTTFGRPFEHQQQQHDEWAENSTSHSPMDFSFTSMTSPCAENDASFYSDLSETEADFKDECHRLPLKALIERDCESDTRQKYSPGRVGPNSPNVLHAKFFQQSSSTGTIECSDNKSNLRRLKAKVEQLHMRGAFCDLRTAGMPSPNPGLLQVSEERCAEWLWTLHKIVIDVVRTDRHLKFYEDVRNMARMSDILAVYAWVDPATGYCQGMSDLLSPFLVLYDDDADAFWCFESLLRRIRQNFQMEGPIGVMQQLKILPKIMELTDMRVFRHLNLIGADSFLFAFRMLLLHFRRELPFAEALRMWEMMWAADFDTSSCDSFQYEALEPLHIKRPSMSLQQRIKEEDSFEFAIRSPYASPQPPFDTPGISYRSKSPLCGLSPRNFWQTSGTQQVIRTADLALGRRADSELSVFIVAAILVTNRTKFLKEAKSMDDAIKMFNEIHFKIKVRPCIQTAMKLRIAYRQQLAKRAQNVSSP